MLSYEQAKAAADWLKQEYGDCDWWKGVRVSPDIENLDSGGYCVVIKCREVRFLAVDGVRIEYEKSIQDVVIPTEIFQTNKKEV